MELGQSYVVSLSGLLYLFAMGMVTAVILVLLCTGITGLFQPHEHHQRLTQIQDDKVQTERELSRLTQDYVQRVSHQAQQQQSQVHAQRTATQPQSPTGTASNHTERFSR